MAWHGVSLFVYIYEINFRNKKTMVELLLNRTSDVGLLSGVFGYIILFKINSFDKIRKISFLDVTDDVKMYFVFISLIIIGAIFLKSVVFPLFMWKRERRNVSLLFVLFLSCGVLWNMGIYLMCRLSPILKLLENQMLFISYIFIIISILLILMAFISESIKKMFPLLFVSQVSFIYAMGSIEQYGLSVFHSIATGCAMILFSLSMIDCKSSTEEKICFFDISLVEKVPLLNFWCILLGTCSISFIPGFFSFFSYSSFLWVVKLDPRFGVLTYLLVGFLIIATSFVVFRLVFTLIEHGLNKNYNLCKKSWNEYIVKTLLILLMLVCFFLTFLGVSPGFVFVKSNYIQTLVEKVINSQIEQINIPSPIFVFTNSVAVMFFLAIFYYLFVNRKKIGFIIFLKKSVCLKNTFVEEMNHSIAVSAKTSLEIIGKAANIFSIADNTIVKFKIKVQKWFILRQKLIFPQNLRLQILFLMTVIICFIIYLIINTEMI